MKKFFCCMNMFLVLWMQWVGATIPACPHHSDEIYKIRRTSADALVQAHRLTGDIIFSLAVTIDEIAWNSVKYDNTYTEFSKTFQGGIDHCNKKGKFLATQRLYQGFNDVGDLFLVLYNNCILNHHNYRSVFERGKIYFDRGNIENCLIDITDLIEAGYADDLLADIKPADLLITKGQALLEAGQYEKAIEALSDAIKKDPTNKVAYFNRAIAYFETGNFDEALKDYLASDKGKSVPKSSFIPSSDFVDALLESSFLGAKEAAIEFVPSMCNSAYGLSCMLWNHALHPIQSTKEIASACYEMGECFYNYCSELDRETIEGYVDELKDLYIRYDQLSDSEKGNLIGYAVGKYGTDIFIGSSAMKVVAAYRNLKTANTICNLEAMAMSTAEKEAIVASSLKHAAERRAYFKNVKIQWDKQNKHIPGTNNFQSWKGYFTIPSEELEVLAKNAAGTGDQVLGGWGEVQYKERINFGKVIGYYVSDETPPVKLPTTNGIIHYNSKGEMHVVPSRPEGYIPNRKS